MPSALRFPLALAAILWLALPARPASLDQRLYDQIHGRWSRPGLDRPMELATRGGDAAVGLALCASVGLFGGEKARQSAKLALAADALAAAVTFCLKVAVNRQRPEGPAERTNSSFPSGHATGAFALATVFASQYPRAAVPAYLAAGAVGVSRIYLGRHYPSDVLAGALVGFATAKVVLHFRSRVLALALPGLGD